MELSRNDLEAMIVKRAWQDDAFRSEFLGDPKATIEKYAGEKLPAEVEVFAHAEDDSTVHFVIPPRPVNADELSDEDLEKVAGGVDVVTIATLSIIGAVTVGAVAGGAAAATKIDYSW